MSATNSKKTLNVLYVFGGEKAQGAEIVIERMMRYNATYLNTHLILSPGAFADNLLSKPQPYKITVMPGLRKLNRSGSGKLSFLFKALSNYITVSWNVHKYLKINAIDIVHANTLVPSSYLIPLNLYTKFLRKKLRWFWSDHDLKCFSPIDERLSWICLKCYDITFVVSEAVRRKYHNNGKAMVLYNGLDLEVFRKDSFSRAAFRLKWQLGEHNVVIGMAASINPDKGPIELIRVFSRLLLKYPGSGLILAGDYAVQFPEYREKVKMALATTPNVTHIGFVQNTAEFYNGCDIIVNNSNDTRSESLGTTIYEAMACEKIVVASATGGTPEIITDGIDGLLFATGSEADLYNKLEYAIAELPLLDNMRHAAREKVKQRFSLETMSSRYLEVIEENSKI